MPRGIYKRTKKHNKNISNALIGHPMYKSKKRSEKLRKARLGKKHSKETKLKMSISRKGKKLGSMSEKARKNLSLAHLGKKQTKSQIEKRVKKLIGQKRTVETRLRMSVAQKKLGESHPRWKGGVSPENEKIRKSIEYILWRTAVFIRDDYTCQKCNQRGGELHADHIKPFALYPELRFAINNGRTLCIECHKKTNTYGGNIFIMKGELS